MAFKPIQDKEPSQGSCIGHAWKRACQPERVELLRELFVSPQRSTNERNKMKKSLSWWVLLIIAAVSYGIKFVIGGAIGDVFGLLGLLMLLFAIIAGIRAIFKKKDSKVL